MQNALEESGDRNKWWKWWDFNGGGGFLRISNRPPKNLRPPVLAAQKVGGEITRFEWTPPVMESGQLELFGF